MNKNSCVLTASDPSRGDTTVTPLKQRSEFSSIPNPLLPVPDDIASEFLRNGPAISNADLLGYEEPSEADGELTRREYP